jgi:hypothetical protein
LSPEPLPLSLLVSCEDAELSDEPDVCCDDELSVLSLLSPVRRVPTLPSRPPLESDEDEDESLSFCDPELCLSASLLSDWLDLSESDDLLSLLSPVSRLPTPPSRPPSLPEELLLESSSSESDFCAVGVGESSALDDVLVECFSSSEELVDVEEGAEVDEVVELPLEPWSDESTPRAFCRSPMTLRERHAGRAPAPSPVARRAATPLRACGGEVKLALASEPAESASTRNDAERRIAASARRAQGAQAMRERCRERVSARCAALGAAARDARGERRAQAERKECVCAGRQE